MRKKLIVIVAMLEVIFCLLVCVCVALEMRTVQQSTEENSNYVTGDLEALESEIVDQTATTEARGEITTTAVAPEPSTTQTTMTTHQETNPLSTELPETNLSDTEPSKPEPSEFEQGNDLPEDEF